MCRKTTQTTLCQHIGKSGGIDRAATIEKFGYDPDTLGRRSHKRVVAVCRKCGEAREISKGGYRELCASCVKIERFEDHKERDRMSVVQKKYYRDNPETQAKISASLYEHYKNHPETRAKLRAAQKKYHENHPEAREKMSVVKKKYFEDHPEALEKSRAVQIEYRKNHPEARAKHSAKLQGIPYEQWKSFAKEQEYCPAFNEACRESNRAKYGRRCFICGLPEAENKDKNGKQKKLSVHHVDMNKNQGCDGHEWRLVPACIHHHNAIHSILWIARITYLLREWDANIN